MKVDRSDTLWQGLIAGLVGYAVFAIYFACLNVLEGRPPLHTVHALGAALFGLAEPDGPPRLAAVLAYNAVHLAASVMTGSITAFLFLQLERRPALWYIAMFLLVAGLLYSMVIGGIVAREMTGIVSWTHVIIVNILAAVLAGGYLWRAHPRLVSRIRRAAD